MTRASLIAAFDRCAERKAIQRLVEFELRKEPQ